jgi:hypothetical protein
MTVNDVIRSALIEIGQLPIGQPLPSDWNIVALAKLNAMIQDWAASGLHLHALTTNNVTLTNGDPSYTIGASGDFNVRRPVELVQAVLTVGTILYPLMVYNTLDRYRGYRTLPTGQPIEVYYDPQFTLGTLTFYYTPDAAYAVALTSLVSQAPFAVSTETIGLPPEYENPLALNLAMRLMSSFGKSDALLEKLAKEAEATLFTNNSKRLIREVRFDPALAGRGGFNIVTGTS